MYIFHVDTGTMMTLDMHYALGSVMSLKMKIEEECKIPANKQVLLVSGGEVLRPDVKVGLYSAGTDTNPIYLFSKTIIESNESPVFNFDFSSDLNFRERVEKCLSMPASPGTVSVYTQLAQEFWEHARDNTHACEKLVHDQHLQQQGWAAVVANMEDVTADFRERAEDFESKFREQSNKKEEYIEFLNRFNDDLEILAKIPILPALRLNAVSHPFSAFDELHGDSESYDNDETNENECIDESNDSRSFKGASSGTSEETTDSSKEEKELNRKTPKSKNNQNTKEALTLLHWINIKENQESLKHIAEYCQNAMEIFNGDIISGLQKEINEALNSANQICMKQIKGLEERLSGLEELMCEARRIEQDQRDLARAFQKQQSSASICDLQSLKILCESLIKQLQNMFRNHQKLSDMRRRCTAAKKELANNLYHRLKWIVYVENRMYETDSRLMFYHRSLARLKRHLAVVGQLHKAPRLFCTAVHEIVRRRTFSQAFLTWASELACHLLTIHNEEVMRRRNFHSLFSGHFLGDLFPGTEDLPPPFATQAPKPFDSNLPKLTKSDIDTLNSRLPELSADIPVYDMTPVIHFFKLRPGYQEKLEEKPLVDDRIAALTKEGDRGFESETDTEEFEKVGQSPIERGGGALQLPAAPLRTDATTITEVRTHSRQPPAKPPRLRAPTPLSLTPIPEAVNHQESDCLMSPSLSSPATLSPRPPSPTSPTAAPGHRADFEPAEFYIEESPPVSLEWGCSASPLDSQTLVSLLQENMDSKRNEVDSIRETVTSIYDVFSTSINTFKTDLDNLRNNVNDCNTQNNNECDKLKVLLKNLITDNYIRERENIQRLTVDHELEMNDIKQTLLKNDEKTMQLEENILILKKEHAEVLDKKSLEITELQNKLKSYENLITEQNKKIEDAEFSRQKSLKELQDKMVQEHKAEVESLRSRFRLVTLTSMDRSPSESSLEKIERTDMIEISNHNAILLQTQVDFEEKKEDAIKDALRLRDEEWAAKLAEEVNRVKANFDAEKHVTVKDAMKRILEEKDRQLDQYREREALFVRENMKYKETIQQIIDPETSDIPNLQSKIETLEAEKKLLEEKLRNISNPRTESAKTLTVSKRHKMLKGHSPIGILPKTLSLSSCNTDDVVLVLWDGQHSNYTILQESSILFLLHNDSLGPLDLKINVKDESERRLYAIGRVENKEYCCAVKSGNKYQVTVGQRFFRVKVKPLKSSENPLKDISYCCGISLKDGVSSHTKMSKMVMSDMAGCYDAPSKSRSKNASMSKSVCPSPLTTSVREKLPSVSLEEEDNDSNLKKEVVDVDECSADKSHAGVKSDVVASVSSASEKKNLIVLEVESGSDIDINIPVQSVNLVPYDKFCSIENVLSEVAEEATP